MEIILTCAQVAVWLRCSETTVKKMALRGEIPYIKCGKGLRFIASELGEWIDGRMESEKGISQFFST